MTAEMEALRIAKQQLRKSTQATLKRISENDIARQSARVHERLFALPAYRNAHNISIFLSMPTGEISTMPIVHDALARGKKVFVPFIYKDAAVPSQSSMDMVALHSIDDYNNLKPDKWGIPTPDPASVMKRARCICSNFSIGEDIHLAKVQEAPLETLDFVVVPGVAFDKKKRRLGHGKGYYDTFFSRYSQRLKEENLIHSKMPFLVGVALKEQVLPGEENVPTDETDWSIDELIDGDTSRL